MKKSLFIICIAILFFLGLVSCGSKENATPVVIKEEECTLAYPSDSAETVLIPSLTFKMGSVEANNNADEDEVPEHDVTLSCFSIYKKEVSNSMYAKCVNAGACHPLTVVPGSISERYNDAAFAYYPVVGVDYNMASQYCEWVGGRLPTEAEWEFAATSFENILFPWGSEDADCEKAEFQGCHDPAETIVTGLLTAGESPFKVSDLAGNAWEWVFDWYDPEYYSISPSSNPVGPSTGIKKVVRGGAYNSDAMMLLSANRHAGDPYRPYSNVGFRCVIGEMTLPDGYEYTNPDGHKVPNGDDPLDDDDPGDDPNGDGTVMVTAHPLNCPDGGGKQHFVMSVTGNIPFIILGFSVEGVNAVCGWYDQVTQTVECIVENPPATANPWWNAELEVDSGDWPGPSTFGLIFNKPENCAGQQTPDDMSYHVDCPINAFVPITLQFHPAIFWTVTENSFGDALDCSYNNANQMTCLVPDVLDNGFYRIHLEGIFGGDTYGGNYLFQPPACGDQDADLTLQYLTSCNLFDKPLLVVQFVPFNPIPDTVKVGDQFLWCNQVGVGMLTCYLPEMFQGQVKPVSTCFGPDCYAETVTVPNCTDQGNETSIEFLPICSYGHPELMVAWQPQDPEPDSATLDGDQMICDPVNPFIKLCLIQGPQPGDTAHASICIGSFCKEEDIVVPDCAEENNGTAAFTSMICSGMHKPYLKSVIAPTNATYTVEFGGDDITASCYLSNLNIYCPMSENFVGTDQPVEICVNGDCYASVQTVPDCENVPQGETFAYVFCDSDVIKLGIAHDSAEGFVDSVKIDGDPLDCYDQDDSNHICNVPEEFAGQTKPVKVCKGTICVSVSATFTDCADGGGLSQNQCKIHDVQCLSETSISFLMDLFDKDTLEGVPIEDGSANAYMGNHHFDYICANIPSVDGRIYCSGPFPGYAQFGIRVDFSLAATGEDRWCGLDVDDWNDLLPGCAGQNTTPNCPAIKDPNTCLATDGCSLINEGGGFVCKNN